MSATKSEPEEFLSQNLSHFQSSDYKLDVKIYCVLVEHNASTFVLFSKHLEKKEPKQEIDLLNSPLGHEKI